MKSIFSGDYSVPMWDAINDAKKLSDLREALYFVCCKIQELETKVDEHEYGAPVIRLNQTYWTSTAAPN